MSGSRRILSKGDLKKYLLVGAAFLTLAATPKQAVAQIQKGQTIEHFDPTQASASDAKVYEAVCKVFSIKFGKEAAVEKAVRVMTEAKQLDDGKQEKLFITMVVEKTMGKEFSEMMAGAKAKVLEEKRSVVEKDSTTNSDGNLVINTKTENKFGTIKQKKTIGEDFSSETTSSQQTFSVSKLTPEELQEFNSIQAKLRVANKLKSQRDIGNMAIAASIFMSPKREELLALKTRDIIFRDVDAESFVAYNSQTGVGQIWASQDKMAGIRKMVKKAGGISAFVGDNKKARSSDKKNEKVANQKLKAISLGRQSN